jgi:hypothetical protein
MVIYSNKIPAKDEGTKVVIWSDMLQLKIYKLCAQASVHESSLLERHPPLARDIAIGVKNIRQPQRQLLPHLSQVRTKEFWGKVSAF